MGCNWRLLHWFVLALKFCYFLLCLAVNFFQKWPKKLNVTPKNGPVRLGFLAFTWFALLFTWLFWLVFCFSAVLVWRKWPKSAYRSAPESWLSETEASERETKRNGQLQLPTHRYTHRHWQSLSDSRSLSLSLSLIYMYIRTFVVSMASTCAWKSKIKHMCAWGEASPQHKNVTGKTAISTANRVSDIGKSAERSHIIMLYAQ